jgi:GAF domain-containing protein
VDVAGNDERDSCEVLLELLGSIALRLSEADTLDATLQRAVDLGEELMVGCDGVSLMLIGKNGRIDTPAYSTELARDSDQAQYETGQGPCLDAIRDHRTVVIDDLQTHERWPDYRSRALELGIRSTISFRLFVTGDSMGALDMYSRQPEAFDRRSQLIGQVYAAQASVAVRSALIQTGLQTALQSRDVIGQAKGIIMARGHMTADMAFDALTRISQHRNEPLRDVAAYIAETGGLPEG